METVKAKKKKISSQGRHAEARSGRGFQLVLVREFENRCQADPRYSLRKFARDLGVDPSVIARILHGKVEVGPRTIRNLGAALALAMDEIDELVQEARGRRRRA